MGRFLPCIYPPNNSIKHQPDPSQSQEFNSNPNSDSSSSSSNSSISSQSSLPSVPSLHHPTTPTTATAHHHCSATLSGHSSYVFSLALAGKHLYSGASDGEIRVWPRNPQSHTVNSEKILTSNNAVKSIVVLGDKLFTAHHDHKIRVWKSIDHDDQKIYKIITTLPTLNDRCTSLFSAKNYVRVRKNKRSTFVHHNDAVSSLSLSIDGSLLFSVSWDRTLKVWRTSDFKCLQSVPNAHDDAINAVVSSPDGFIYTGSADRKIKVWKQNENKRNYSIVSTLEKHRSAVNALALSTDGSVLYSGACDRSIIVWEKDGGGGAAHMAVAGALRGHTKAILCLAVVADLLCSGSADKSVRVWRRGCGSSYSCLAVFEGHKGPVKCLTAALDSSNGDNESGNSYVVYSGSLDCDIKAWKISVPFS